MEKHLVKAKHWKKRVSPRFTSEQRLLRLFVIAIIAALGGITPWFALQRGHTANHNPRRTEATSGTSPSDSMQAAREMPGGEANGRGTPGRIVYAYSVVPGGVQSVAELKLAMSRDSVVFDQYSAFRLAKARIVRLDHDRLAHVAYRMGNRVYWTKRALKLKRGEMLITDGVQTARTRCGNFVSADLPGPVSPNEPLESALNAPAEMINHIYDPGEPIRDDRLPELQPPPSSHIPPSSYVPPVEGSPFVGGGPGPAPGPGPFFIAPPVPIRPPSGSRPPSDTPTPPSTPTPPATTPTPPAGPPVINAPEPGTAIQFLISLAAILILLRRTKRNRALEGDQRTR